MRLRVDQLQRQLEKEPPSAALVHGDETLQRMESCEAIRDAWKAKDAERQVFEVGRGFDWENFFTAAGNMGLFSGARLLHLRFAGLPDAAAGKQIARHLESAAADSALLVECPRLKAQSQNSAWVKAIDQRGVVLQVSEVPAGKLGEWTRRRAEAAGLKLNDDSLKLLCERTEGNLLATAQEIEKLRLFADEDGGVEFEAVRNSVANNARYNSFQMVDHALGGRAEACMRSLAQLLAENAPPPMMLGAVTRQLRILSNIRSETDRGVSISEALRSQRVWSQQQPLVRAALKRLNRSSLDNMLRRAARVDRAIKGERALSMDIELRSLLLALAGARLGT